MGKVFKSVTKPIAKVLDKIVPNEIKPALPFIAAAFPFLAPGLMGSMAAGLGSFGITNPMIQRALISGGLNLTSQAAQEGAAERGINPLSLALAAGTGALSAPPQAGMPGGSVGALEALKTPEGYLDFATGSTLSGAESIGNTALSGLQSIANPLQKGASADLLSLDKLQAVAGPLTLTASEQAYNAALDAQREYEKQYQDFENFSGQQLADFNLGRRSAILASMSRAGFGEDEITSTLSQLGLRNGGRVGYKDAGIVSLTDQDSGVMYYDENEKPINKEQAMKLFNQQAEEENPRLLNREDILQVYADSDKTIKLVEKMIREGKVSQADYDRMIRLKKNMEEIGNLSNSNYLNKEELYQADKDMIKKDQRFTDLDEQLTKILENPVLIEKMLRENYENKANGGIIGLMGGGMPSMEMDYRGGGFIPVGAKEKADDVPARLSKNEFVMTADAVRAAGGGSVNEGARRMYELMNNLEARA